MTSSGLVGQLAIEGKNSVYVGDAECKLKKIREFVNKQAEDEGLWFYAETAPEAYVQHELRKLHKIIEE